MNNNNGKDALHEVDLPAEMRDLVALMGLPATLLLVKRFPGLRIKVPSEYSPGLILVRAVGHDAAIKMIDHYRGCVIYVPRCLRALNALRNMQIVARMDGGESASTLALEFELSERHIWNVIKRPEALRVPRPEQPRLF